MIIRRLNRLGLLAGAAALVFGAAGSEAKAQGAGNAAGKGLVPPPGAAGTAAPGKATTPPAATTASPPPAAAPGAAAGATAASTDAVWRKVCGSTAASGKPACVMIYEIRTAQGQLVSQVSIQKVETDAKYTVRIVLPVGVYLPPGVTLLVDGKGKAAEAKFTECASQPPVCVAEGAFEAAIFDAMRKGTKLIMAAKSGQQKDMSFELSLASFAKAYDGPASTPGK